MRRATIAGVAVCVILTAAPAAAWSAAPAPKPVAIPRQGASWDWQLTPPLDLSAPVRVLDLDPDQATPAQIRHLRARGVYPVCYVSVGTWENWRKDKGRFPPAVLGRVYGDWPDERFLDIRRMDILLPIMRARFRRCAKMGFLAVEADNMDVHDNPSGFPLTPADTLRYVSALAREAHRLGLALAQKNAPELSARLVGILDFAIVEGCFRGRWCARMKPWLDAGRPVFAAEYRDHPPDMKKACRTARRLGMSLILKTRDLTTWRRACP